MDITNMLSHLKTRMGFKNPLAQAFGIVLRRYRDRAGKTSKEISDLIGIGASYYRLIESGTNHLHVSKALALVEAFEGKFSFDAISKILMAISIMEAVANNAHGGDIHYAEALKLVVEKLSEYDRDKLKPLFLPFQKYELFDALKTKTAEKISDEIEQFKIDQDVDKFIVDYVDFGKSHSTVQKEYSAKFLEDIPTIYVQFLSEVKANLLRMPVKMGVDGLWQWEELNKNNFVSIIGIVKEHKYITSLENLQRYKYRYLWEPNFDTVKLLYMDDAQPGVVTTQFRNNLKKSLKGSEEKTFWDTFEEKIKKVQFKQCPSNEFDFQELTELEFKKDIGGKGQSQFNTSYVFLLNNKSSIGFLSYVDPNNVLLASGRSLQIESTYFLVNKFNNIWDKI